MEAGGGGGGGEGTKPSEGRTTLQTAGQLASMGKFYYAFEPSGKSVGSHVVGTE